MEAWFPVVVAATFLGGAHIFIQRIGTARGYSSNILNSYSGLVSAIIGFTVAFFVEGYSELSWFMVAYAAVNGGVYLFGANLRMDAMRYIDTTVLLPLHKFVSPLFVLVIGLFFFQETLTQFEWLGIILGMTVPLLLISKGEHERQNDLSKGLILMVASAGIVAINAAVNKEGVTTFFTSVLLFSAVSHLGSTVLGLGVQKLKRKKINDTQTELDRNFVILIITCGLVQFASFAAFLYSFALGGPLAIVYTIHSLYIVIPIVLSIIFFKEHWNARKVVAILASIAAIMLMR